jgi:hypothetical protein
LESGRVLATLLAKESREGDTETRRCLLGGLTSVLPAAATFRRCYVSTCDPVRVALWAKLLVGAAAVLWLLPLEVVLVRSIPSDVSMLSGAFGLWGLLFFASPTLASIVWRQLVDPMYR